MAALATRTMPNVRVLDRPDHHDHGEHRAEDRVEAREDVGPDDLAERAAGALAGVVRLPARDALLHLGRGEAGRRRLDVGAAPTAVALARVSGAVTGCVTTSTRHERDLAGGVVLEHAVAAELGEPRAPLVGTDRDQLVAGLELAPGPRGR